MTKGNEAAGEGYKNTCGTPRPGPLAEPTLLSEKFSERGGFEYSCRRPAAAWMAWSSARSCRGWPCSSGHTRELLQVPAIPEPTTCRRTRKVHG